MKKIILVFVYICLCSFALLNMGCASKTDTLDPALQAEKLEKVEEDVEKAIVIPKAESMLGVMYKYGGTTPKGFDCSGFVQWVYKHAGVTLPRRAKDQARAGEAVKSKDDIQVGDIVAFRRGRVYHTGIYVGDGKFIHSPRTNKDIRISDMDVSYFGKYYIGTRRVAELGPEEKEAARELLDDHESKKEKKSNKS